MSTAAPPVSIVEGARLPKSPDCPRIELQVPWYRRTLPIALCGSVLLWAAMPASVPPLSLGWLAWFAPLPWLLLVRRSELPGRRPYPALWLAGLAFWLLTIHWIRLPHPALYLGWFALSAYLAIFLPVFVGLSRVAVHRLGAPLWLAAPIVWTGLELARAHLLTGFLMASLAHTQVHWNQVIQISDLFGEYGVDFVIMLVAASLASVVAPPRRPWAIVPAALVLSVTLIYGQLRLNQFHRLDSESGPRVRVALIQGNSLAEWKADPNGERQIMDEYLKLSEEAVATAKRQGKPIDLLVWPETMFRSRLVSFDPDYELPAGVPYSKDEVSQVGRTDLARLVDRLGVPLLVGIDRMHFPAATAPGVDPPPYRYNSTAVVDRSGDILATYDKIHRVMFGEYIPFAKHLPFLYRLTPLTGGIEAGDKPLVFELNDRLFAPNICYETVIPHVIRRQAGTLADGARTPDVLINLTNDAWYWGSSELDQHLACGVFRAIETRRPLLIAANGGISAWIDHTGAVRAKSPKQQPNVILADVELAAMQSWYLRSGDWFAAMCLTCCALLAIIGLRRQRAQQ